MQKKQQQRQNKEAKLNQGEYIYSIATGHVAFGNKASEEAAKLLSEQEGFKGLYPSNRGVLWFYDSLNHAKVARNVIKAEGNDVGTHICKFKVGKDGVPDYVGACD